MDTVIVAFENAKFVRQLRELLESSGVAECLPCSSGDQVRRLLQRQPQAPWPAAPDNQFDQFLQIHLAGHGGGQLPLAQLLQ